jgi:hypothetical protein
VRLAAGEHQPAMSSMIDCDDREASTTRADVFTAAGFYACRKLFARGHIAGERQQQRGSR